MPKELFRLSWECAVAAHRAAAASPEKPAEESGQRALQPGEPINHAGLLRYLVSFRTHNVFHEQCVERIFVDLMQPFSPQQLTSQRRR